MDSGGSAQSPDRAVLDDHWSDLRKYQPLPEFDIDRMRAYRRQQLRREMRNAGVDLLILVNPVSMRYALDYDGYALFQTHIPETYAFYPLDGPVVLHGASGPTPDTVTETRPARPLTFFDAGTRQLDASRLLAEDVTRFLGEIASTNRRVAVEFVNPSLTQALQQQGLEVVDGVPIAEMARVIKNDDELACIRWSIAVAEHGMRKMKEVLRPGVTEGQLWGLLNYTNLANHGGWHDGRMLASGPRCNPWLQEATQRVVEAGDLVAFDTDMVGPMGYFADVSRTFFCGPGNPTARQKQVYRLAYEEVTHNLSLVRSGITLKEIQQRAYDVPEEFREQAYPCIMHAVGLCDEYPRVNYLFRGDNFYDCALQPGMVMCVESYMGAVGDTVGVKLEQQVLVTSDGYQLLSSFPWEEALLD